MTSKKLGALLQSVPPATARAVTDTSSIAPAPDPESTRRMIPAVVGKDEPEVPLQVLVPARIREELGIMVAKERGASLRSLILRAIRASHESSSPGSAL